MPSLVTVRGLDCCGCVGLELDGLLLLAHIAQRTLLNHQSHDLVQSVGGGHGGQLRVGVVRGGDFDNVGCDEVDALQAADDGAQLASGPAAGLRGAGCRGDCAGVLVSLGAGFMWRVLTGRVKSVDVDAEVDGLLRADSVFDLLDDAINTDLVYLTRLDNLEAAVAIVLIVRWPREGCADSSMNVSVVGKETFLSSVEEVGAVVDGCLLAG